MVAQILAAVLVMAGSVTGITPMEPSAQIALLGGTVLSIDENRLSVTLRMPEGEVRLFAAKDRRLLQGINNGDHVSFELDENEKITRLVKLPTDPAN